jgi:hypothetical protein
MKNIKDQLKDVLKNDCLNQNERIYLKNIFKNFIDKRYIISRKKLSFSEEESSDEWIKNNIG